MTVLVSRWLGNVALAADSTVFALVSGVGTQDERGATLPARPGTVRQLRAHKKLIELSGLGPLPPGAHAHSHGPGLTSNCTVNNAKYEFSYLCYRVFRGTKSLPFNNVPA